VRWDSLDVERTLLSSVVIATSNRPGPLSECLHSLAEQTRAPAEVVVVDASSDELSCKVGEQVAASVAWPLVYTHSDVSSAAGQRNRGIDKARSEIIVFLDDDVVCEREFLDQVLAVFEQDATREIGGVGGTIVNQTFRRPSRVNRWLLAICVGPEEAGYGGRLVGPAVNFLPDERTSGLSPVDWLPTTCAAFRAEALHDIRFPEAFKGYSFAEDVYLSARVRKAWRLLHTAHARVIHKDLGRSTHCDWSAIGQSMILNRASVMVEVLGRSSATDFARLLAYELAYCTLADLRGNGVGGLPRVAKMLRGKLAGAVRLRSSRSRA
jgi:GT2 family glycosyltransferase